MRSSRSGVKVETGMHEKRLYVLPDIACIQNAYIDSGGKARHSNPELTKIKGV